jgi:hypothetical protein
MDLTKHNRSVDLQCPTCGGSSFSGIELPEGSELECFGCGLKITRQELVEANSEHIAGHVDEVKKAVMEDVQKAFRAAFKGIKGFKVR